MQKTTAKCAIFMCKKHCILHQFPANFAVFLAYKFGAFSSVFRRKICRKLCGNFPCFSSFFVVIFYETVCRDGKGGIPVKSRCKCGNPDRDCTENTRFFSAMSTKSEIGVKVAQIPLVTSSAAEIEMKAGGTLYSTFFKLFNDYFNGNVCREGIGWDGIVKPLSQRNR